MAKTRENGSCEFPIKFNRRGADIEAEICNFEKEGGNLNFDSLFI